MFAAAKGHGKPVSQVSGPPAAAQAREHHLHGGELHGGRHAAGARRGVAVAGFQPADRDEDRLIEVRLKEVCLTEVRLTEVCARRHCGARAWALGRCSPGSKCGCADEAGQVERELSYAGMPKLDSVCRGSTGN